MPLRVVVNYGRGESLQPEPDQAMGGIKSGALALSLALGRRGHDVHVFARCPSPGRHDGVTFHDRADFARFSRAEKADVLVAIPEVLPLLMPLKARARVVWSGNSWKRGDCALVADWNWAGEIGPAGRTARLYSMRLLHPYVDRIVAKSRWQAQYMSDTLGIPKSRFSIAHNGVPLQHYRGTAPDRRLHRLVYTSQAERGLDVLLRLFPQVRARAPEAELHIFGYKYSADHPLPDLPGTAQPAVSWRGRLSKSALAYELRSAGLMAYPCRFTETFCTAVAEAQAAGLPVVTTDNWALAERVSDGVDGYLIRGSPDQPEYEAAFAEAVVKLLRDDDLSRRMGAQTAKKAHQLYDWDVIASGWERDLVALIAGREALPPSIDPALNLLDPSALTVAARGMSARVPSALAEQWLREAWTQYGFDDVDIPGLLGPAITAAE